MHINVNYVNALYRLIKQNYDYIYLKSRNYIEANTLIVGSSYAAKGIDVHSFSEGTINLCCSSQDLYYDQKLIEQYIGEHKNKEYIIILIVGYYDAFRDLLLESNEGVELIKKIYWPLTGCIRNSMPIMEEYDFFSEIKEFDIENRKELMDDALGIIAKRSNYYNDYNVRSSSVFSYKGLPWWNTPISVREKTGRNRAIAHNKCLEHQESLCKNVQLIDDFLSFINDSNAKLWVVVPPFSKYYSENLDLDMIRISNEIWASKCELFRAKYIDFNKWSLFEEGDFLDMDHLNNRGALRFSRCLASMTCAGEE
ncbi:hypothetical protein [Butyrivibrio fibrisolvens]|uniref:hypothetical protein n=1 Tax=Butyrivibrio fibrisolvens TaxID=831 RepID=UPI0004108909|nr:hypothetical protein [Butyrivibrio fibrisolvens]